MLNSVARSIHPNDRSVIERTYAVQEPKIEGVSPAKLADMIASRIHDEWDRENGLNRFREYDGNAVRKLIDDEVHYELCRLLKVPHGQELKGVAHDLYLQTRERVLVAVTTRATRLFGRWGGKTYPPHNTEALP